jgi:hypothetical protein
MERGVAVSYDRVDVLLVEMTASRAAQGNPQESPKP